MAKLFIRKNRSHELIIMGKTSEQDFTLTGQFSTEDDAREAYRLIQLVQGLLQKSKPAQVPARRDNFHGLERADNDVPSIDDR